MGVQKKVIWDTGQHWKENLGGKKGQIQEGHQTQTKLLQYKHQNACMSTHTQKIITSTPQ